MLASKIAIECNVSSSKISNNFHKISEDRIDLPTPSQSGVWRQVLVQTKAKEEKIKEIILKEQFCLHFDGKKIKTWSC